MDLIVLLFILLGTISLSIYISKASLLVVFKMMRVAASLHPDPLHALPMTPAAPRNPGVSGEQELV